MTLIEHLGELRSRIIKVAVVFFALSIVAWFFRKDIFEALLRPAPSLDGTLNFTSVTAPLITDLKLSLFAAFLFTIPVLLYQGWAFIAPAVSLTFRRLLTVFGAVKARSPFAAVRVRRTCSVLASRFISSQRNPSSSPCRSPQ